MSRLESSTIIFLSESFVDAHNLNTSVPYPNYLEPSNFFEPKIKSSGSIDFYLILIFWFWLFKINPWVFNVSKGDFFWIATDESKEQRNHRVCSLLPSMYMFGSIYNSCLFFISTFCISKEAFYFYVWSFSIIRFSFLTAFYKLEESWMI